MSLEDVTWTVLGPHTARVSGKISCEYDSVTKERQPYDYIRYQDYRYPDFTGRNHHTNEICGQGRAYNHRTGGTTRQTYVPTTVKLRNPYGPDVTVSVNSDGRFSGEVAIGERYYFTRLSVPAYYGKYHHTSPSKLRVSIPPHESLTFPNKYCELPKFHFAKPNVGRAEQFAMNYASGVMCPVQIAFKEYRPRAGILGSPWIGLSHFRLFIGSYQFKRVMLNTIGISIYQLLAGFPFPIILALSLNEVRSRGFKKSVQMMSYLPHFISTVVFVGITYRLLSWNRWQPLLFRVLEALAQPLRC